MSIKRKDNKNGGKSMKKRLLALLLVIVMTTSLFPMTLAAEPYVDNVVAEQPKLEVISDSPATVWESEATPIGNGYIGAMVFGGVEEDRIQINEETIWSGGPGANKEHDETYNGKTPEENWTTLANVREIVQEWMNEFEKTGQSYFVGNGTLVTSNYPTQPNVSDDRYGQQVIKLLQSWSRKYDTFGSYQTLGDLWVSDANWPLVYGNANAAPSKVDEDVRNLFDGSVDTKWCSCTNDFPKEITVMYGESKTINSYSMVTANDAEWRDPKAWTLYGSNDGQTWNVVDQRSGQTFNSRGHKRTFALANAVQYMYYKLSVTEVYGYDATSGGCQLAEFSLEYSNHITYEPVYSLNENASPAKDTEGANKLFDGIQNDANNKWCNCTDGLPKEITADFGEIRTMIAYSLTSAGDADWRDPKAWTLYGRNSDSEEWTAVDTRSNIAFESRNSTLAFDLSAAVSYKQYKLSITATRGGDGALDKGCQLAEIEYQMLGPVYSNNENAVPANGEVVDRLFDGNLTNKWCNCTDGLPKEIMAVYPEAITIEGYSFTSANDAEWRDPKAWTLYGRNVDSEEWKAVDARQDVTFTSRAETQSFTLSTPVRFSQYKLSITATKGGDGALDKGCQLAEIDFKEISDTIYLLNEEVFSLTKPWQNYGANSFRRI